MKKAVWLTHYSLLGCSWHADEDASQKLAGGFVLLAERKARQHVLLTGLCWCLQLVSPCFWYKETTSPCVFSPPETLVNFIAPFHTAVASNPGEPVEHSTAAIHLTSDIDSAR